MPSKDLRTLKHGREHARAGLDSSGRDSSRVWPGEALAAARGPGNAAGSVVSATLQGALPVSNLSISAWYAIAGTAMA